MNELQLSKDINVITAEINSYKNVAGQAIFEIGRRLKYVKENDLVHGEWSKWCESIDIPTRHANKFIKVAEELDCKWSTSTTLGFEVLYQIATLPEEQREELHTIPSTGETKTVNEMTVKELREVKKALKEAEDKSLKLEEQLEKERNKPTQIETVVKEVDKTDYKTIEELSEGLQSMKSELDRQKQYGASLKELVDMQDKELKEYEKFKKEMGDIYSSSDDMKRQIDSAASLGSMYAEIEHFLQNKLAPVKYSRAITERKDSPAVIQNLSEIIAMVEDWTKEMKSYLPNKNIIDVEVCE